MPGSDRQYSYRQCSQCEAISCNPLPTAEELSVFYEKHFTYVWYEAVRWLKAIQSAHRWRRMKKLFIPHHIKQGNLLDVGCGHGWFLKQGQRSGWNVRGVDYPSLASTHAREKLGLEIVEGDLRTVVDQGRLKAGQFDFITAWHCLEHDPQPLLFLERLNKLLTPGGKLLLAVPNAGCLGMTIKREDWVWCQPPYLHVYHFTERNLTSLLQRAGMKVVASWTRDTWDAHPLYDLHVGQYIYPTCWDYLCLVSGRAAFWTQQLARLTSYAIACPQHWLVGRERMDGLGSELLVLTERDQSIGL